MNTLEIILGLLVLVLGGALAYLLMQKASDKNRLASSKQEAESILFKAKDEAEKRKKEFLIEAKDEAYRIKKETELELREQRSEVQKLERRISQKEEQLERKITSLEKKEEKLSFLEEDADKLKKELQETKERQIRELENLSGLTREQAKEVIFTKLGDELEHEAALRIKEMESRIKEEADKKASHIIALSIQKCAVDHVAESCISVVHLPNDEIKGRIIGREGRNIRALEAATGVDLIVDDTPEAVVISGFDPIRREIARQALEKLVSDGRIHPGRIEEVVEKARRDVERSIKEAGEQAVMEVGLTGLHPEIVKLMGRLKYRTSYGQNVLLHSIEVAHVCGLMAAELGTNIQLARRVGFLHDLGKAVDHEMEGPHALLGMELAKKFREGPVVYNAIGSHHGDIEQTTIEDILAQVGDAISASRPGARRETLDLYVKRLQQLEEIASSYKGIEKSFAIQAGREVRLLVRPEEYNDVTSAKLARDVANRIEKEMTYPGQIKVTVIRESRATEVAK